MTGGKRTPRTAKGKKKNAKLRQKRIAARRRQVRNRGT